MFYNNIGSKIKFDEEVTEKKQAKPTLLQLIGIQLAKVQWRRGVSH